MFSFPLFPLLVTVHVVYICFLRFFFLPAYAHTVCTYYMCISNEHTKFMHKVCTSQMSIQHITYNMYIQKQHIQLRFFPIFRMCIRRFFSIFRMCIRSHHFFCELRLYVLMLCECTSQMSIPTYNI